MPGTHAGKTTVLPERAAQAAAPSNCPRLERISSFLKEDNCSILKLSGSRRKTQARGSDALSLGWEAGGVQGRAASWLLCWMDKVLNEKHESSCYCVPAQQISAVGESRDLGRRSGCPSLGYQAARLSTLKSQRDKKHLSSLTCAASTRKFRLLWP